jgi:2'-5' RNA ligase
MRLFYAAFLSRENMSAYQALVEGLTRDVPGALRTIPPTSHHLTLAFLGEVAESAVDTCIGVLQVVEDFEAFPLSLGPPRILMGRGLPRLICADITEGGEQVSRIQRALCRQIEERLPSVETRPKPPHVTLARFKRNARRQQARRVKEALIRHHDSGLGWHDHFSLVSLVESSLTPSGPIYETVSEARLSAER